MSAPKLVKKKSSGRPPHSPTTKSREEVSLLTAFGVRQEDVADMLNITLPTLHKHYKEELNLGAVKANARVSKTLYRMALSGKNTEATKFWLRCRARWRDVDAVNNTPEAIEIVNSLVPGMKR